MRILLLSQYFWPENFRINDLASELIARGHEVTVLTGLPNYPEGEVFPTYKADPEAFARYEGANVYRVPIIARGRTNLRLLLNYLSFALGGVMVGGRKLKGTRFDAIFVFQISPITSVLPALWLKRRRKVPVLVWVLDLWPETLAAVGAVRSPFILGWVGRLVRFIYSRTDRILVQSRAFYGNVQQYAGGTDKIRYFPGWPEPVFANGTAAEPAPEFAPYRNDFKVLFAGNLGQAQDLPSIIAAADLLRNEPRLRWFIVGDGRAGPEARAEVVRRGLKEKVIFLGKHPIERMPAFFLAADCLLVSLRDEPIWSLTIPGKVQSYLGSGRPIVGMLNGEGARVIAEAGAGLAGPAGDAKALAANMKAMMELSPDQRRAMGERGRRYCREEFDRGTLVDRLEGWVEEVRRRDGQ